MSTIEYSSPRPRPRTNILWLLAAKREYGLAILLAVLLVAVTIRSPSFLSFHNIEGILAYCAQTAIVACGVMLVIVTGEIDISVGSALGFLTAILGTMVAPKDAPIPGLGWPVWLGILVTLAAGTGVGLINGLLVTIVRVPSIIATLAMLMILKSVMVMIMHRGFISNLPESLSFFGTGRFVGVLMPIWVMAAVVVGTWILVKFTPIGRRIYAVGSNTHAASLSGISVTGVKIFVFALTGFLVGVATIITQLSTFDNLIGAGLELLVVTCVVVGGVSISGGVGSVLGVFLGVVLLTVQKTFLIFLKLGPGWSNWDKAIQGGLILAAVLIDHVASRRTKGGGSH